MKKYLTIGNILLCSAVVLAVVAIIVGLCVPAISYTPKVGDTITNTGAQITFGYTEKAEGALGTASLQVYKFSFPNLLPYIFALVGMVFAVLAIFGKLGKISVFVAAGCFLVAGVLFFCAVPFTMPASDKVTMEGWKLGAGAIVGGVFGLVSAVCCALKAFVFKK